MWRRSRKGVRGARAARDRRQGLGNLYIAVSDSAVQSNLGTFSQANADVSQRRDRGQFQS